MRQCPKCKKVYDDSWKICLGCSSQLEVLSEQEHEELEKKIDKEKQKEFEENWEVKLQDEIAKELNVSKETLVKTLKARRYPLGIKVFFWIIITSTLIASLLSIDYFRSAVYFERFKFGWDKAWEGGNLNNEAFEFCLVNLHKSTVVAPDAKKPWTYTILLNFFFGKTEDAEELLEKLPFRNEEKDVLRMKGLELREQMNTKLAEGE